MNPRQTRSRHPHPAMKWTLLVGFVAVLVLGVPGKVAASPPNVKPPTGASTGGYFTGTYSFEIYIQCQSGLSFSSSYSNSLEGTHVFSFDGANDGSLLVRVDSGGDLIVYSCGDPTATSLVSSYTVSRDTVAPSVNISSPANGSTTSASSVDIAVSAGDSTSGIGQVTINGVSAGYSGGLWHAPIGLNVGGNSISTIASDNAGHSSSDGITITRSAPSGGGGGPISTPPASTPPPHIAPTPSQDSNSPAFTTPSDQPPPEAAPIVASSPKPTPIISAAAPKPSASPIIMPKSKPVPMNWVKLLMTILMVLPVLIIIGIIIGVRSVRKSINTELNLIRIRLSPYTFRLRIFLRGLEHTTPRSSSFSHNRHTGKVLARHHTSYPALIFLILCTTVLSGAVAFSGRAANETLSFTVLGPPPTNPAYISSPLDGATISAQTTVISGTCPTNLVIEIYRDGAFAGSTYCDGSGLFSLSASLNVGINTLVARDVDGLGQYGPDSNIVRVTGTYVAPTPSPSPTIFPVSGSVTPPNPKPKAILKPTIIPAVPQLSIDTDQHYLQGISPDQPVSWQLKVIGGLSPFSVNWNWGDSKNDLVRQTDRASTSQQHRYRNPGFYRVTVTVKDASGQTSLMQLLVVVNGTPVPGTTHSKPDFGNLMPIWPLLAGMLLLVISFWLGEHAFRPQGQTLVRIG